MDSGDLLENGQSDKFADLKNRAMARANNLSDYSALNIAARELAGGLSLLKAYADDLDAPLISTNVFLKDRSHPLWKPWVMSQVNGLKVAILGVVSPDFLDIDALSEQGIEVNPVVSSLRLLLPEVREKADLVVVMANTGMVGAKEVASQLGNDIDLVLTGRDTYTNYEFEKINGSYLFKNTRNGQHLNIIKCYMKQSRLEKVEDDLVPLDGSIKTGEVFIDLVSKYKREVRARKKALRLKKSPQNKVIERYKNMTPQEYMDLMKKKSAVPHKK